MEGRVWVRKLTKTRATGTATDNNINPRLAMIMYNGWKPQTKAAKTSNIDAEKYLKVSMKIIKARPKEHTMGITIKTPRTNRRVNIEAIRMNNTIELVIKSMCVEETIIASGTNISQACLNQINRGIQI